MPCLLDSCDYEIHPYMLDGVNFNMLCFITLLF